MSFSLKYEGKALFQKKEKFRERKTNVLRQIYEEKKSYMED